MKDLLVQAASNLSHKHKKIKTIFERPPLGAATPDWMKRIEIVRERVQASGFQWLDYKAIMTVFEVSRATSVRILNKFPYDRFGNVRVISREALLEHIDRIIDNPRYQIVRENETARWQRIAALRNPSLVVRYNDNPEAPYRIENLPDGIELTHKRCVIHASSRRELISRLTELALFATRGGDEDLQQLYGEDAGIVIYE